MEKDFLKVDSLGRTACGHSFFSRAHKLELLEQRQQTSSLFVQQQHAPFSRVSQTHTFRSMKYVFVRSSLFMELDRADSRKYSVLSCYAFRPPSSVREGMDVEMPTTLSYTRDAFSMNCYYTVRSKHIKEFVIIYWELKYQASLKLTSKLGYSAWFFSRVVLCFPFTNPLMQWLDVYKRRSVAKDETF